MILFDYFRDFLLLWFFLVIILISIFVFLGLLLCLFIFLLFLKQLLLLFFDDVLKKCLSIPSWNDHGWDSNSHACTIIWHVNHINVFFVCIDNYSKWCSSIFNISNFGREWAGTTSSYQNECCGGNFFSVVDLIQLWLWHWGAHVSNFQINVQISELHTLEN